MKLRKRELQTPFEAVMKILSIALLLLIAAPASADAVGDAFKVCQVFKNTGVSSDCEVSGGRSTVDVRIDTSGKEAEKICAGVAQSLVENRVNLGGSWQLRVFSPFSADRPLAACGLR